jgi:hypothetical protein
MTDRLREEVAPDISDGDLCRRVSLQECHAEAQKGEGE